MKTLLVDMSPVLYSNLFSATSEVQRGGVKAQEVEGYDSPKVPYNYEDIVMFKILEEISLLKTQFRTDEVVLAFDNSKGGYWRKDYWSGYKYTRSKSRSDSPIMWDKAFQSFDKLKEQLHNNTTFKCVDIERVEGDDVIFVLSEYLSDQGQEVIIHSLDHDLIYNLKHPGVSYFRTKKAQKKAGEYVVITPGEILELEIDHLIGGDPGDYIKNVKAYSRFSKEFKNKYPDKNELDVWEKRHEIDVMFEKKYGVSAYNHPRYGYKMFMKSALTVQGLLAQNPIYQLNYDLNKKVAMPDGIPQGIRHNIIEMYNDAPTTRRALALQKFFKEQQLFEMNSKISFL